MFFLLSMKIEIAAILEVISYFQNIFPLPDFILLMEN